MLRSLIQLLIMLSLVLGASPAALATGFSFATIDVPGASRTAASGINDSGQVVGIFWDTPFNNAVRHGFLKDGASFTQIDVPGHCCSTNLLDINNAGQMVGFFEDSSRAMGFVKDGAGFTLFDFYAFGINDAGQIVGASGGHGFFNDGVNTTQIDVPGAGFTQAFGINNAGQIVGVFGNTFGISLHGFLKDGTNFIQIDVPGAIRTEAFGINDAGQIVGDYFSSTVNPSERRGFIYDGATFTTFDIPGNEVTEALDINDAGQIAGFFEFRADDSPNASGARGSGFIAASVPEPGLLLFLAFGLVALFGFVKRPI